MPLRSLVVQRPVLLAVLCAASQFALTVLILEAGMALAPPSAFGTVRLLAFASTVLLPLLLVQWFGLWRRAGLAPVGWRPTPVFMVALLSAALFLSMGVHRPAQGHFAGDVAMQAINAFGEELLFRGVIFALLLGLPRGRAVVLSGVLFGSMHLIHGFMDGDWGAALAQAAVTSMAGTLFTAVRYGSASLWPVVVLHMLLNLSMLYSNVPFAAGPTAMFAVERLANLFELALAAYVVLQARRVPLAAWPSHAPGLRTAGPGARPAVPSRPMRR